MRLMDYSLACNTVWHGSCNSILDMNTQIEWRNAVKGSKYWLTVDIECATCGLLVDSQVFFSDNTCYCNECGNVTDLSPELVAEMIEAAK